MPTNDVPTRKQSRGETTALRALAAALTVHDEAGHEGFTIHAIAKLSGVSVGSLYHHFGSFDGLAASLYAFSMNALMADLALAVEKTKTAKLGILALTRGYLSFTKKQSSMARFIHASSYAAFLPAHAAMIDEAKRHSLTRLFSWLRPHVRSGEVIDLPPELFEMLVIGPVAETARRWLADPKAIDLAKASSVLPERIWLSVKKTSRS